MLDVFTEADLERWSSRSHDAQRYSDYVYFDLERQRAARHDELCDALRAAPATELDLSSWARICDYRWSLQPLSSAGSLKGIGGRFNIGSDLDRARGQQFPALYIAQNVDTAFFEFFGGDPDLRSSGLTLQELSLRRKTSFVTFSLSGHIENVLDLRTPSGLKKFASIISQFDLSHDTLRFARKANFRVRSLLRTTKQVHKILLTPPKAWRAEPQLLGIPAPNQIFSRYARDAGFEGILYPSQAGGDLCLAIYPDNLRNSDTSIHIVGSPPPGATHLKLDRHSAASA